MSYLQLAQIFVLAGEPVLFLSVYDLKLCLRYKCNILILKKDGEEEIFTVCSCPFIGIFCAMLVLLDVVFLETII